MRRNILIALVAMLASISMTAQSPKGSWDSQKWPGAEPYSADLARDFTWKPGPSNQPLGTARGIFPGRVVMSRYPEAAHWSGRWNVEEDQWFLDCNTDKDKCEEMISATLCKLTGARNDRKAWKKIFIHHNAEIRGLRNQGYTPGETVAIKINLNNSSAVKTNNQSDATPQMTLALVRQLVHKAGVPEDCIIIYEVRRQIYSELLNEIWQEFPDVRFVQDGPAISGQPENPKYGGSHGLEAADWVEGIEYTHDKLFNEAKLIARQVKDATYLVNMAMLKLHSYPYNYMEHGDNGQTGITMSAKNHAGSIKGTPEIHKWINSTQIRELQNVEHGYNPLVDLEASPNLGRKTILYLLDGLYCGRKWSTYPLHFPNAPFYNRTEPYENPDWPACLLASMDPVALQSVGLDILYSQSLNNTEPGYYNVPRILLRDMADDILKEMAAPSNAPSGTVYKQQGQPIPSLGVFEHWDDPSTMRYSRNLDPKNGQGIEFIYIPMGSATAVSINDSVSGTTDNRIEGVIPSDKKEIMDRFVAGTLDPSYVPALFFGHFGAGKTLGEGALKAHLSLFLKGGSDMLKIQTEQAMPYVEDLTMDTPLVPEDYYRPTLELIKEVLALVGKDVYVMPTILSTYQVARQGLGDNRLPGYAVERPEAYRRMLDSYTKAILWYIRECKKAGVEAFFTATQGGERKFYDLPVPGGFFETLIKPYDLEVMNEANRDAKITILHICDWEGPMDDLTRYLDYPGMIINVPVSINGEPQSLAKTYEMFGRPVLGGFDRQAEIGQASPEVIAGMTREIIANGPRGHIMVGADCSVPSPLDITENIHAAVSTAHGR